MLRYRYILNHEVVYTAKSVLGVISPEELACPMFLACDQASRINFVLVLTFFSFLWGNQRQPTEPRFQCSLCLCLLSVQLQGNFQATETLSSIHKAEKTVSASVVKCWFSQTLIYHFFGDILTQAQDKLLNPLAPEAFSSFS